MNFIIQVSLQLPKSARKEKPRFFYGMYLFIKIITQRCLYVNKDDHQKKEKFMNINLLAWENSRRFARSPLEPSQNDVWVTSAEVLMTRHYPDLGSASDWLKREGILFQPIRSTT